MAAALTEVEARYFRNELQGARAEALRDAEGFVQVLFCLERMGLRLYGSVAALGQYRDSLLALAVESPLAEEIPETWPAWHTGCKALYDELVHARNDALHQGAFARLLTNHALQVALMLEDALMADATRVSQFMVRNPVTAAPWQPVSFVRQLMLLNSFSYLPIRHPAGQWSLLAEAEVGRYVRLSRPERRSRLASTVESAVQRGQLVLLPATIVAPDTPVEEACEAPRRPTAPDPARPR